MLVEAFWATYETALAADAIKHPEDFALRGQSAQEYAAMVAPKMRRAVEAGGFGAVNYTTSRSMRAAAKRAGVPFNRAGLDSLYLKAAQ